MNGFIRSILRKPYYSCLNFIRKIDELICFLIFSLKKKGTYYKINDHRINFFDVGSLNGLVDLRVKKYFFFYNFYGFDPNNNQYSGYKKIFNNIIDQEKGRKKFFLTKIPDLSSTLKPNIEFQKKYHDQRKFKIVEEQYLECDTIDNISANHGIDVHFLKIDTQGTALKVLKGSENNLKKNVIGVEIEVEFQETYIGQDTYLEICNYLNELNFEILDILDFSRWEHKDLLYYGDPRERSCGRLVYSNFLFFKKFEDICVSIEKFLSGEEKKYYLKKILNILLSYEKADYVKFLYQKYSYLLTLDELRCYDIITKSISFKLKRKKFVR